MFWLFIMSLAAQRIAEMIVARRNEQKVKSKAQSNTEKDIIPFSS